MSSHAILIPARFKSSRLPGKPLIEIFGKALIERVWERCRAIEKNENIFILTDNSKIHNFCKKKGINSIITPVSCMTGTDRIYFFAKKHKYDFYINVKGDEIFIDHSSVKKIINGTKKYNQITNGYCEIKKIQDFKNVNVPKLVFDIKKNLLYMSRAPIPLGKSGNFIKSYKQICIYGFPRSALMSFGRLKTKTPNEKIEDIEILRFLEIGLKVKMIKVKDSLMAIDVFKDINRAKKILIGQNIRNQ